MREDVFMWIVQTAVILLFGVLGWSFRKMLGDLDDRIKGAENRSDSVASELRAEIHAQSGAQDRKLDMIQARLNEAERRGAADQAVLERLVVGIDGITSRIDSLYSLLTKREQVK